MDFNSILSLAEKKQKETEKEKHGFKGLATKFSAPKKEQKQKEKSDTVKRLLEEKKEEKRKKEKAAKRTKEDEAKGRKVAEIQKKFKISKADGSGDKKSSVTPKSSSSKTSSTSCSQGQTESGSASVTETSGEVVIHWGDFIRTSDRKRKAHNSTFIRPPVAPCKENEDEKPKTPSKDTKGSSDRRGKTLEHSSSKRSKSDISDKSSSSSSSSRPSSSSSHRSSTKSSSSRSSPEFNNGHRKSIPREHSSNASKVSSIKPDISSTSKYAIDKPKVKPTNKPKPKPQGPPPMAFEDLLKLAEIKHKDVPDVESVKKAVKSEPETMLTQEEKDRIARRKTKEYQQWLKTGKSGSCPSLSPEMPDKTTSQKRSSSKGVQKEVPQKAYSHLVKSEPKINARPSPTVSGRDRPTRLESQSTSVSNPKSQFRERDTCRPNSIGATKQANLKVISKEKERPNSIGATKHPSMKNIPKERERPTSAGQTKQTHDSNFPAQKAKVQCGLGGIDRRKGQSALGMQARQKDRTAMAASERNRKEKSRSDPYTSTHENVLVCGPGTSTRAEDPAKAVSAWDRIYGQIQKNRPLKAVKRRIEDDDDNEEADSSDEDDEFIDDDDGPAEDDYRSHLKALFGYSYRDRFKDFDDSDGNMEASYAQQMKEEVRSARLGKLEDLEDMRQEEEELRRKKLAQKKKMKFR